MAYQLAAVMNKYRIRYSNNAASSCCELNLVRTAYTPCQLIDILNENSHRLIDQSLRHRIRQLGCGRRIRGRRAGRHLAADRGVATNKSILAQEIPVVIENNELVNSAASP